MMKGMDEQAQHGVVDGVGSASPTQPQREGNEHAHAGHFGSGQRNGSATEESYRNASEHFDGASSNGNNAFRETFPSTSETDGPHFGTPGNDKPVTSDSSDTVARDTGNLYETGGPLNHRKREERHDVAIKQAADVYRYLGMNVTDRSVNNWVMRPEKGGKLRLADSGFDEFEGMWYIAGGCIADDLMKRKGLRREGVLAAIEDAKAGELTPKAIPVVHEDDTSEEMVESEPERWDTGGNAARREDETRSKHNTQENIFTNDKEWEVAKELIELRIEVKAKDMFIDELRRDREKMSDVFSREREQFLSILSDKEKLIAEKDQQLKQLEAPRSGNIRDAEFDISQRGRS